MTVVNQELTGDENKDSGDRGGSGLSVKREDTVCDLGKGKVLSMSTKNVSLGMPLTAFPQLRLTTSFSMMALTPWIWVFSQVSIEWSRYRACNAERSASKVW